MAPVDFHVPVCAIITYMYNVFIHTTLYVDSIEVFSLILLISVDTEHKTVSYTDLQTF